MWLIGIRSGIITVLGLVAYGLFVQITELNTSIWGNLEYVVFALGIYSGHYYYKYANRGFMSYGEGIQVGLIVIVFTGLVNSVFSYAAARFIGPSFIKRIISGVKIALQQSPLDEGNIQEGVRFIEANMTPELLLVITFFTTLLTGLIFTLLITVFSKRSEH
ncbi:MAG: DUF4199 domain-containing protein [Bacteroidota bacterium]